MVEIEEEGVGEMLKTIIYIKRINLKITQWQRK
jgi:hypothetical protein